MDKLSFVIPCYGSELTLAGVVNEIIETVQKRNEYSYEIILVNDSSPDGVYKIIKSLGENNKCIKGIDLARNFGQHSALMTGFNYVTGDIIICLDDDGQTPANEMFNLIEKIIAGYDLVIAKYESKKHNWLRNFGSKINNFMAQHLIGKPKDLSLMSYFACKRFIIDEAITYKNSYPYVAGLLLRATNNIINVSVNHRERKMGRSGYTLKKLLILWLNGFTAFSVKPLRIATFLGIFCALFGFVFSGIIIIKKLVYPSTLVGYASLMSAIFFIGGMLMLMLGMIGEYIGRIYICLNNSPQYVIREKINIENKVNENE